MKTVRITLSRPGAEAVCLLSYHFTCDPLTARWTGNRKAFRLSSGTLPQFCCPLDQLPSTVPFQAAQSGALWTIEDLGGEAIPWMDEICGGGD